MGGISDPDDENIRTTVLPRWFGIAMRSSLGFVRCRSLGGPCCSYRVIR